MEIGVICSLAKLFFIVLFGVLVLWVGSILRERTLHSAFLSGMSVSILLVVLALGLRIGELLIDRIFFQCF